MTNIADISLDGEHRFVTKPIALTEVEILFCVGFENLCLTKREAKKIAADSRFPAPKYCFMKTNDSSKNKKPLQ
jgi:hypothetical protein